MLPVDWEEYLVKTTRELSQRPQDSPKKARPVKKMMSPRQRQAMSQSGNFVRAALSPSRAQTVDPAKTTFTTNLGGSCEPDAPHGKATGSRS